MFRRTFRCFVIATLTAIGFSPAQTGQSISFEKPDVEAVKRCGDKELSVTELWNGFRLDCLMQDLQADVTMNGAIIRSTSESEGAGVFSIRAARGGREGLMRELPLKVDRVNASDNAVSIKRAHVVEEYTASCDGIRQDFIITGRPEGMGKLFVELAMEGAAPVLVMKDGIKVRLASGRELVYHALRVFDATGKRLEAEFGMAGKHGAKVAIDDSGAKYPIRIDPTITDADWVSMGGIPGVDEDIYALVIDPSGNLYTGGEFTVAGEVVVNHVARWDGSTWSALGSGMNGNVYALEVDNAGNLYVGGRFDTAGDIVVNGIAKWDGNEWSALGGGVNGYVNSLAVDDSGTMYAGGRFDTAGGVSANNIARWDGNTWSALGSGTNSSVFALVQDNAGNLYAGGGFNTIGGTAANAIAKWDGSVWSALGNGMNWDVKAIVFDNSGNLYAGGTFDTAGSIAANCIAKWDGDAWSALGSGINNPFDVGGVWGLAFDGEGNLYAGGCFDTAGNTAARNIARWDGTTWNALGSGVSGTENYYYQINAFSLDSSGNLYAGGLFTIAGGTAANNIAKWNGTAWSALGSGTNYNVHAFASDSSGNLYAGGEFTTIGGIAANCIAKWDGSTWSALGSGMGGILYQPDVYALALDNNGNLYAGGEFTTADGAAANHIAKWDGFAWSALGSGMNGRVKALVIDDDNNLYAGGKFDMAGGVSANNIARWDGNTWSAMGSGMNNSVSALATNSSGNLYAGGSFIAADGAEANHIAKWNGYTWGAMGSGMNNSVTALVIDNDDNLYAGGDFDTAGGTSACHIAKWDGGAWNALGSGISGPADYMDDIYALSMDSSGNLYAGGEFTTAGGTAANRIARWDGSVWSAMGSGIISCEQFPDETVFTLLVDNSGTLYAGGEFIVIGGKVSAYIAQCKLTGMVVRPRENGNAYQSSIVCNFRSDVLRFRLQHETSITYRIFTLTGREALRCSKLLTSGTHSLRINTATIAKGAYIVQVQAGKESMRFRMTKKR